MNRKIAEKIVNGTHCFGIKCSDCLGESNGVCGTDIGKSFKHVQDTLKKLYNIKSEEKVDILYRNLEDCDKQEDKPIHLTHDQVFDYWFEFEDKNGAECYLKISRYKSSISSYGSYYYYFEGSAVYSSRVYTLEEINNLNYYLVPPKEGIEKKATTKENSETGCTYKYLELASELKLKSQPQPQPQQYFIPKRGYNNYGYLVKRYYDDFCKLKNTNIKNTFYFSKNYSKGDCFSFNNNLYEVIDTVCINRKEILKPKVEVLEIGGIVEDQGKYYKILLKDKGDVE